MVKTTISNSYKFFLLPIVISHMSQPAQMTLPWAYIGEQEASRTS